MTTFEAASRAAPSLARDNGARPSPVNVPSLPHPSHPVPTKGFFNPTPTRTTTAVNSNGHLEQQQNKRPDGRAVPAADPQSHSSLGVSEPSSLAKARSSRPRRESLGQMRRKASDSATAAASAGGVGIAFANARPGQPIPSSAGTGAGRSVGRGFSTSPRFGTADGASAPSFSTSLGSAAEALSLPASVLNSGAKSGRPTGHTHFGQECYGPEPGETIPPPPPHLTTTGRTPSGIAGSAPNGSVVSPGGRTAVPMARRGSLAESAGADDEVASTKGGKELPIHRCESCNKVYRHPSCLVKHRWEHTVYWKEASKFLMSKHQQVQLLEAAAILVNMDGDSASLPEEKALWPAAVSPASSGLLGSDRVNFDRLMQRKAALRGRASSVATTVNGDTPDNANDAASVASSGPRSLSAGLSPLNSFSKLGLSGTPASSRPFAPSSYHRGYSYGSLGAHRHLNSDVQHLTLDESDERTTETTETETSSDDRTDSRDRSGSAETTEDDDDVSGDVDGEGKGGDKKWGLHEDALAEMDMDE
ncbi:unnamed protein product [Parajaminaea phylloscopi]